jgi:hypothetical protein
MAGREADVVFVDAPNKVAIHGHVSSNDLIHHWKFQIASGETNEEEFIQAQTHRRGKEQCSHIMSCRRERAVSGSGRVARRSGALIPLQNVLAVDAVLSEPLSRCISR